MDNLFLPEECDWFETAYPAGRNIVLGVNSYREQQRKADSATERGGFRAGPQPIGMLIIKPNPIRVQLVKHFNLINKEYEGDILNVGYLQSSYWDGTKLLIGTYGYLADADLESETADLIEEDEVPINRLAVLKDNSATWIVTDEGGAAGGCIEKHDHNIVRRYFPINLNNAIIHTDAIIKYKNKILTSSLAGVVEIDERNHKYVHYQLTDNPLTMRVYNITIIDDSLWGLREDGWINIDIENKSAMLYQFSDKSISNNIFGIVKFEGLWYIATENALVIAKM
jgi:hypothetical protein